MKKLAICALMMAGNGLMVCGDSPAVQAADLLKKAGFNVQSVTIRVKGGKTDTFLNIPPTVVPAREKEEERAAVAALAAAVKEEKEVTSTHFPTLLPNEGE